MPKVVVFKLCTFYSDGNPVIIYHDYDELVTMNERNYDSNWDVIEICGDQTISKANFRHRNFGF